MLLHASSLYRDAYKHFRNPPVDSIFIKKMQNKGLLFIPDISGFTRFVNETDIDHSRLIIQELLEVMINANQIGLEVSEIEGDAILFYKFGESPNLKDIYKQVEKMFCDFHRNLIAYEDRRFCQCKACISAINLTLKVITHYGEFTGYNVKNFNKLIGKDIIVAHQLLKNDIDKHEYWLVTKSLLEDNPSTDFAQWMKWDNSAKQTENGEIYFQYTQLSELKNKILPEKTMQLDLSGKVKMISVTKEFQADMITLFHAAGDFNNRSRWQEGVKAVEEVGHFLPRVGMRCRRIHENGPSVIYSSSYSYNTERIEFSETEEKEESTACYTLEKTAADKTRLTLDFYVKKNYARQILFRLAKKKKMEDSFRRSLQNLEQLAKEIILPAEIL